MHFYLENINQTFSGYFTFFPVTILESLPRDLANTKGFLNSVVSDPNDFGKKVYEVWNLPVWLSVHNLWSGLRIKSQVIQFKGKKKKNPGFDAMLLSYFFFYQTQARHFYTFSLQS